MVKLESVAMGAEKAVSTVAGVSMTTVAVPGAVLKGIKSGIKNVVAERKQQRAAKKAAEMPEAELTI